jgi:hypothetical protein
VRSSLPVRTTQIMCRARLAYTPQIGHVGSYQTVPSHRISPERLSCVQGDPCSSEPLHSQEIVTEVDEYSPSGGCIPSLLHPYWDRRGWRERVSGCVPTGERWTALKRIPLLTAIVVATAIAFLCGCQTDKEGGSQGGSRSSEATTQAQKTEEPQQTLSGDLGEAQGGLGPRVEKIMDSQFYRYGEWGSIPQTVARCARWARRTVCTSPAPRPSSSASRRPSTNSASATASKRRSTPRGRSRTEE